MGRGWGSVLVLCVFAGGASADTGDEPHGDLLGCEHLYEKMWPQAPSNKRASLSLQITDELTELGNLLGHHVNTLSNETLSLDFDGRKRRAKFRVGLAEGPDRYVHFKVVGDIHFTQGRARAKVSVEVGVGERVMRLDLPDVEMTAAEYQGDRGIALVMPVYKREF